MFSQMHHQIMNQHLTTINCSANQHIKLKNASVKNPYLLFNDPTLYKKIPESKDAPLILICISFCCRQVTSL